MKKNKFFSKKTIIAGSVILVSFLFILMAFAPALSGAGQTATPAQTEKSYIPNPQLNSNITWSTFHNGWKTEEYSNGTGNKTLTAPLSSFYANPISVNPVDIQGSLQNYTHKIATSNTNLEWTEINGIGEWAGNSRSGPAGGAVYTISNSTGIISFTINTSAAAANDFGAGICVDTSSLPSNTLQYDYFTGAVEITAGSAITGLNLTEGFNSNHANRTEAVLEYTNSINTPVYVSVPLSQYAADIGYTSGSTSYPRFDINLNVPVSTTATTYTVKLFDFGISTYANSLGSQIINGTSHIVNKVSGNAQLTSFDPSFKWTSIINGGYSVAVSQVMENVTESQTSISDGNYIEQATYQGILTLPTAPDLSYSNTNITLNMALPGKQYEVANLNGVSYLSSIQAKTNGTFAFGTANANNGNTIILEAKYTASQWDSSTHAPSFFTLRGLEYYWWVGVIAGLSIIGLGAAAVSHFGGVEEDLKVPKGKFGR